MALGWGHPIRGDTPSLGAPTRHLTPQGTSNSPTSASPGTCGGASGPTPSAAPCSTWVRGGRVVGTHPPPGGGDTSTPAAHPLIPSAPEVLSGGPYSHAADWWSLGVLLFALASGEVSSVGCTFGGLGAPHGAPKRFPCPPQFPVAPAGDHVAMLERVNQSSYSSPPALSPALARLLAEVALPPPGWGSPGGVSIAQPLLSIPSCCATTPCAACATSTTSRTTLSSAG